LNLLIFIIYYPILNLDVSTHVECSTLMGQRHAEGYFPEQFTQIRGAIYYRHALIAADEPAQGQYRRRAHKAQAAARQEHSEDYSANGNDSSMR
jgi:hypothetical protein